METKQTYILFKPFLIKDGKAPNNYLGKITSFSSNAKKIHIGKISKNIKFYQILGPFKELFEQLKIIENENKENIQRDNDDDNNDDKSNNNEYPKSFKLLVQIIQLLNSNIFVYVSQYIEKMTVIIAVMEYSSLFINDLIKPKKIYYYPSINEIISRRAVMNDNECENVTKNKINNGYTIEEYKKLYNTNSLPERVRSYLLGPYPPCNIKDYKISKIQNYQEQVINHGNLIITDMNPILESIKKWILDSIKDIPNFTYSAIPKKNQDENEENYQSFKEYQESKNTASKHTTTNTTNTNNTKKVDSYENEVTNVSRSGFAKKLSQQKNNRDNNVIDNDFIGKTDDGFTKIIKKKKF
jgi:hypothetical protein